ncbi:hypothetical protein IQ07DRAFT_590510 [Pyrenochaeta sp. DS3sAY3a]|nr:hypothetical protein IQ07DRAFT_590510 [Pyrenochaeta sp. DS3sAY3a]
MAEDDRNAADDDLATQREFHFNAQRSSYRSSLNSNKSSTRPPRSRRQSDLQRLDDFDLGLQHKALPDRADSDTLPSPVLNASPSPSVPFGKRRREPSAQSKARAGPVSQSPPRSITRVTPTGLEDRLTHNPWMHPHEFDPDAQSAPPPIARTAPARQTNGADTAPSSRGSKPHRSRRASHLLGRGTPGGASGSQLDITALPTMDEVKEDDFAGHYVASKRTPKAQRATRYATELYTVSYLIFFAIWGSLARLGLQALTFYPGAPVIFSELWANVAGTFIMGFLAEDRRLFRAEWGFGGGPLPEPADRPADLSRLDTQDFETQQAKARHGKVKKTIPMYIGLATGFCGSFTSFSSFIRDVFLSLSNDLHSPINHPYPPNVPIPSTSTTVARNGGYSLMAICATIIITIATCYGALKAGAHFAILTEPLIPTLPFRFTRRVIDPLMVFLGWGTWLGAIIMTAVPPHNAWRGQALFACVFAPIGCLLRYYVSLHVNRISPSFPLGTFAVNIFGTAVLGMAYDLQHVPLRGTGAVGGSIIGCQVLQGIMDGFCGALTTVSTWILELDTLKRRHAYVYGGFSVLAGLCLLIIIMGSVKWTVGWHGIICVT